MTTVALGAWKANTYTQWVMADLTSSVSGNAIYSSCFRIFTLSCCAWSVLVRWRPSPSAVVVTQLVTQAERGVKEQNSVMPVFTPDDEPYLGVQLVHQLDLLIVPLMQQQTCIAAWTHSNDLTHLQQAASELAPGACSLVLSIRESVRQGYLLAALVLTRPLFERVATLSYLVEYPAQVELWRRGWSHKGRPPLHTRMKAMGLPPTPDSPLSTPDAPSGDDIRAMLDRYNGLVHGDPASAYSTAVLLADGRPGHAIGKDLSSPQRANQICGETLAWVVVLMARCAQIFPAAESAQSY